MPRRVGLRQLAFRSVGLRPVNSLVGAYQDISALILHLGIHAAEHIELVVVPHHACSGEAGEVRAVDREVLHTVAAVLCDGGGILEIPSGVQRGAILCEAAENHRSCAVACTLERHCREIAHGEGRARTQGGGLQPATLHVRQQESLVVFRQCPHRLVPCHEHGFEREAAAGITRLLPREGIRRGIEQRVVGIVELAVVGDDTTHTRSGGQPCRHLLARPCGSVGGSEDRSAETVVLYQYHLIAQRQDMLLAVVRRIDGGGELRPHEQVGVHLMHRRHYLIHLGVRRILRGNTEVDRADIEIDSIGACEHYSRIANSQHCGTRRRRKGKFRHHGVQRRAVHDRVGIIHQSRIQSLFYLEHRLLHARERIVGCQRECRQFGNGRLCGGGGRFAATYHNAHQ